MMDVEEWRDIEESDGHYQVSNLGNIRSWCGMGRYAARSTEPRVISQRIDKKGYRGFDMRVSNNRAKSERTHRLVAKAFLPNPNNLRTVNHKDGNKLNNHVDNLEWASYGENNKHAYDLKLNRADGVNNGRAKLTYSDVLAIRSEYSISGCTQQSLATKYGVGATTIKHIIDRTTWADAEHYARITEPK